MDCLKMSKVSDISGVNANLIGKWKNKEDLFKKPKTWRKLTSLPLENFQLATLMNKERTYLKFLPKI